MVCTTSGQFLSCQSAITLHDTQQTLDDAPFAPTPHPAGQQVLFFSNPLIAYRSGPGKNNMMLPLSNPLSDKEIANLVDYFARLPAAGSR
jgi:cytochrome c553